MLPEPVVRLTRLAGIKAQIGYKCRPGIYGGRPAVAIDNTLDRQLDVAVPDEAWGEAGTATGSSAQPNDITYIRTCEGFDHLAVVIDFYSHQVIGCAMQSRQTTNVSAHGGGRRKQGTRC